MEDIDFKSRTFIKSKEKLNENIRYFKTYYSNVRGQRISLNYNDRGNFLNQDWVTKVIHQSSDAKVLKINDTIEISKKEFDYIDLTYHNVNANN